MYYSDNKKNIYIYIYKRPTYTQTRTHKNTTKIILQSFSLFGGHYSNHPIDAAATLLPAVEQPAYFLLNYSSSEAEENAPKALGPMMGKGRKERYLPFCAFLNHPKDIIIISIIYLFLIFVFGCSAQSPKIRAILRLFFFYCRPHSTPSFCRHFFLRRMPSLGRRLKQLLSCGTSRADEDDAAGAVTQSPTAALFALASARERRVDVRLVRRLPIGRFFSDEAKVKRRSPINRGLRGFKPHSCQYFFGFNKSKERTAASLSGLKEQYQQDLLARQEMKQGSSDAMEAEAS
eukprot:gene7744-5432_t